MLHFIYGKTWLIRNQWDQKESFGIMKNLYTSKLKKADNLLEKLVFLLSV
jgi:hypothetical protein